MRAIGKMTKSPRARAAGAALLIGGVLTYAGVAGAAGEASDVPITLNGDGLEGQWDKGTPESGPVPIATGDTVTWNFAAGGHNLISTSTSLEDPRWDSVLYPRDPTNPANEYKSADPGASTSFTFYKSGTYTFECKLHSGVPGMTGTVVVTGEDQPIPTPTPTPPPTVTATATPSPTVTPTSTPTPPVDDHLSTPAPSPAADTVKPAVSGVKLRAKRRAVRVKFKLSENATVTVQIRKRGAKKVLRTVTLQARAGKRSVVVRSSKLRKGRYTVTLAARDAMGNKSAASTSALRIRK